MQNISNSHKIAFFSGSFHASRMLIGALQALYLLSTGVSLQNLAFLKAYFAFMVLIFDLPFGMLSEWIGNKICIYLSCLLVALYYLFSLYSPQFHLLLIAETCYAMGLCMISGSLESFMVNAVRQDYPDHPAKISHFYFLSGEIMAIGSMIAAPLGAMIFIFNGHLKNIYLLSCGLILALPGLIYGIKDSIVVKKTFADFQAKVYFKNLLLNQQNLLYILVSGLVLTAYQPIYHYWQPFFIHLAEQQPIFIRFETSTQNTACILASIFFVYSLANYLANHVAKKQLSKQQPFWVIAGLSVLLLTSIIVMIILPPNHLWLLIALFATIHGLMTIFSNLSKSVMVATINKHQIATVISMANVMGRLLSTLMLFICALFINNDIIQYVFGLSLIAMLLSIAIYLNTYQANKTYHHGEKECSPNN